MKEIGTEANTAVSVASIFTSASTLVCCALPALLVALGAGATLASLVQVFPQMVWLSEHKIEVFAAAAVMLALAGALQWRARYAPCPLDPALRDACLRARGAARSVYFASVAIFLIGAFFAFVAPSLNS